MMLFAALARHSAYPTARLQSSASSPAIEAQYKTSILKEAFRKSIHMCCAFVPLFLGINYTATIVSLAAAAAAYSASEVCRMHSVEVPLISRITRAAARRKDEDSFALGPVMLVLGIVCAALLWKEEACRIGVYALAFGDGLASLVGRSIGRVRIPFLHGKTVAGSLACFMAVFVSSFAVCQNSVASLCLSFAAMFTEMMPLGDADNLFIPVIVGCLAQAML